MTGVDTADVYDRIRRGIVEGHYAPGARLVEQRLAEELAVSRTPVREALRRLESEGLVIVERNRGAQVRPLADAEVADLYEVRGRLEGYAAELAARRASAEEVSELRDAARSFTELTDELVGAEAVRARARAVSSVRELDASNARFHRALHDASHHARIRHLIAGAVDAPLVFRAFQQFDPTELRRSALFHELVADAVGAGEAERAGRLMTEHVLQGRDTVVRRMADADVDALLAQGA